MRVLMSGNLKIDKLEGKPVLEIMNNISYILDNIKGVWYWFSAGTCLGLVREEKGFISWDTDIDIEVDNTKGTDHKKILVKMEDNGYDLVRTLIDNKERVTQYAFKNEEEGVIIDFYFYYKEEEEVLKSYTDVGVLVMPQEFVTGVEYRRGFRVPHPVEDYLKFRYGKDWKTPIPKDRGWNEYVTKEALIR